MIVVVCFGEVSDIVSDISGLLGVKSSKIFDVHVGRLANPYRANQ